VKFTEYRIFRCSDVNVTYKISFQSKRPARYQVPSSFISRNVCGDITKINECWRKVSLLTMREDLCSNCQTDSVAKYCRRSLEPILRQREVCESATGEDIDECYKTLEKMWREKLANYK